MSIYTDQSLLHVPPYCNLDVCSEMDSQTRVMTSPPPPPPPGGVWVRGVGGGVTGGGVGGGGYVFLLC